MSTCLVAIGGNLGNVPETISAALGLLAREPVEIVAVSRLVRSAPMGSAAGIDYVNAAASLNTSLVPEELLARLQGIETALGRDRTTRWGPRAIDLDLVTHGSLRLETEGLTLPHPGCWWRRFVLDPIVEIAPNAPHPVTGETFATLRERLVSRPLAVEIVGGIPRGWLAQLAEQLGPLAPSVQWNNSQTRAAIRLDANAARDDPDRRTLAVPGDEQGFLEFSTAILTAAVACPVLES